MIREIRLYVEGGGDGPNGRRELKNGLGEFLDTLRREARTRRIRWNIIACGGRDSAFDDYRKALKTHRDAFNVLLVDAEGPVDSSHSAWEHLHQRDSWKYPAGISDDQCHLMVQAMEAWFIADREALRIFFGQDFHEKALPARQNVEDIPKDELKSSLREATRKTTKGEYQEITHGAKLLARINADKVCEKAPHCKRLFESLRKELEAPS